MQSELKHRVIDATIPHLYQSHRYDTRRKDPEDFGCLFKIDASRAGVEVESNRIHAAINAAFRILRSRQAAHFDPHDEQYIHQAGC